MMTGRERFRETMRHRRPDRVPYFEEGIRGEVLEAWHSQGMAPGLDFSLTFPTDQREEIKPDLDPRPSFRKWPASRSELGAWRRRLDPRDPGRLPGDWSERIRAWRKRDYVLMLRVHRGFFLTMGVGDWRRFSEVIYLLKDDPDFVREALAIQGEFAARFAERVLRQVEVDAVVFSEPIGGNDRPLISPQMYEEFVLSSYEPLLDVLCRYGIDTIIFRTYANVRALVPSILKWGINCLWACEVNIEAMDYVDLRREFGRDLRLIGGIDLDALRRGKEAIQREIEDKVPPLLAGGGYVPLADGRIREDVPFENYVYYRQLWAKVTRMGGPVGFWERAATMRDAGACQKTRFEDLLNLVVLTFDLAPERHKQTLRWSLRAQEQTVNTANSRLEAYLGQQLAHLKLVTIFQGFRHIGIQSFTVE
jgi:hypothetical protein